MTTVHDHDINAILQLAEECAHKAGEYILTAFHSCKHITTKSSIADLVTEHDKACEEMIINMIVNVFPNATIIAEERDAGTGTYDLSDNMTWFIDPIDGTNNFVHSIPWTCVSIGCSIGGRQVVGIVYNPILNELFSAKIGGGAHLNGKPISVSSITKLSEALLISEFGYARDRQSVDTMLSRMRALLMNEVQSVRFFGSCALNMCSVACGRADAYYEGLSSKQGPKPWDFAAAQLILTEAGGFMMDHDGSEFSMVSGRILCAGTKLLADNISSCIAPK